MTAANFSGSLIILVFSFMALVLTTLYTANTGGVHSQGAGVWARAEGTSACTHTATPPAARPLRRWPAHRPALLPPLPAQPPT